MYEFPAIGEALYRAYPEISHAITQMKWRIAVLFQYAMIVIIRVIATKEPVSIQFSYLQLAINAMKKLQSALKAEVVPEDKVLTLTLPNWGIERLFNIIIAIGADGLWYITS